MIIDAKEFIHKSIEWKMINLFSLFMDILILLLLLEQSFLQHIQDVDIYIVVLDVKELLFMMQKH